MAKTHYKTLIDNAVKFPNLWGFIIPLQFLGAYSIYNLLVGQAPSWWFLSFIIGFVCINSLGISAGYHRLFCHRGFEVNLFVKRLLLYFGVLGGQGSPIYWIAIHRGYHHRHADREGDAHSPSEGFWHSYILWMFKMERISIRSVVDLLKDRDFIFFHRHYIKILWATHFIVMLISVDMWLYLLILPTFITLHSYLLQLSVTHMRIAGYRNYKTNDDSVNVPWLFPVMLGECWHNNHHGDGRNPNFKKKWWEFDPVYLLIRIISKKS